MRRTHLAIVAGNYLEKILAGEKTIESRFSLTRCAPFRCVSPEDIVWFKKPGTSILAEAEVQQVKFYEGLSPDDVYAIEGRYHEELRLDPSFLQAKARSKYCTLIFLTGVRPVRPFRIEKKDRRGWVVLAPDAKQMAIEGLFLQESSKAPTKGLVLKASQKGSRFYSLSKEILTLGEYSRAIEMLRSNGWRDKWWRTEIDTRAAQRALNLSNQELVIRVERRLRNSVGTVRCFGGHIQPYRDGFQTPYSGNMIFYAQHALAVCCRKCIEDWYGIPNGRDLLDSEIQWFTGLVMTYIEIRLKGSRSVPQ